MGTTLSRQGRGLEPARARGHGEARRSRASPPARAWLREIGGSTPPTTVPVDWATGEGKTTLQPFGLVAYKDFSPGPSALSSRLSARLNCESRLQTCRAQWAEQLICLCLSAHWAAGPGGRGQEGAGVSDKGRSMPSSVRACSKCRTARGARGSGKGAGVDGKTRERTPRRTSSHARCEHVTRRRSCRFRSDVRSRSPCSCRAPALGIGVCA